MTDVAAHPELEGLGRYKFGWSDSDEAGMTAQRGLSEDVVRNISTLKSEPEWMLDMRLKGLRLFEKKPMPNWGADLSGIDFDNIKYFVRSTEKQAASWDDLPADIKNTYDKLGIPEAEKQRLVAGVAAQYECLSADTLVWTADRGQIPIKEIRNGDRVFSYDEESERFVVSRVKSAAQTGEKQTYRVRVGGRTIRATDNHPFLVLSDERKPGRQRARFTRRWKPLAELNVGDLVAVPRDVPEFGEPMSLPRPVGRQGEQMGPETTNVDLMWLLGLYIGNGSFQSGGRTHRIQFAIPATDQELRAELSRVLLEQFGLRAIEADDVRVVVNSRALVEWFQVMGFWGDSHSKRVPPWVYGATRSERLAFLGGWVDADGYIRPDSSGSVVLTSVNAPLIDQARELAQLAGLPTAGPWSWDQPYAHEPSRTMTGYRLGISGAFERLGCRNLKRTERFGRRQYSHSSTSAKGATFRSHCTEHLGFARITEIEPYEIEPVYDIEVDGPHNFIADGLVVHNSEVVYHQIREDLEQLGVIFVDTDTGLREYEDLFREYFASVIPAGDNKFSALNTAVWSGGSFIYVPKGVKVDIPLQAYFRINTENMGQFERTLIIADEGSYVHYVEGCLPAGELVTKADGSLHPIETVRVGDHVVGHDGRPHRVTAVQMRDLNGTLHTFTPMSPANAFSVTDEHPLLVVPRRDVLVKRAPRNGWLPEVDTSKLCATEPSWVPAKDVEAGDFLVFPKPKPEPAKVVLPLEFARLAGYYLAEGSAGLTNGHESLCFSFHIDEHDYVDEVRRASKDLYDAEGSVLFEEEKHSARVLIHTKAGHAALKHHVGTGSSRKQLSGDLMAQDDEFLRELVRCYVNGDGNVVSRGGVIWKRVHTTSRVWAFQLQAILARLGNFATVELRRPGGPGEILGRNVIRKDLYQVQWTENGSGPKQARDCGDYFLVPIKKRSSREAHEPVYNLDVEEPDSYLAYGFAVHNCTAPIYSSDSLHSAVVEIVVKKDARVRYTTIQNWSNNVYNLVTKRAMAHEGATMEWIDGNLGCLAEGSTVTTPAGVKPIEQLTPGDQVLSYDDQSESLVFRTVLAKKFSGIQPVREVRVGERALQVTDNHPFLSYAYDGSRARKSGRYGFAYVRADHLTEALVPRTSIEYGEPHKLAHPDLMTDFVTANQHATDLAATRSRRPRLELPETTTDDVMWLLGAFLGDGSIDSKAGVNGGRRWAKVTFSIPTADRARPRLERVLGELAPAMEPTRRADGVAATWNSVELAEFIESNGFGGNAHTKRVPAWVASLPESQRLAFVAGLLDSDGCASNGRRGFSIKSVSAAMLGDVAAVLTTLGITARLHTEFDDEHAVVIVGRDAVAHGAHRLEFACDARLVEHVSPRLRDAAEAQTPATLVHHRTIGRSTLVVPDPLEVRKVEVSEHLGVVPTWDIEVEGTGNFVSQGFVVHNSKVTMKYPAVWMVGEHARGETLSIAFAGEGQHQDAGSKMVHAAPNTSSNIVSKSVARGGGRTSYRGLVQINKNSHHAKSTVKCDALLIDNISRSDTYPYVDVREDDVQMGHEATVSKVSADQLFYLMQRGISEEEAMAMIVRGFIEPIARELPMEYALELNRLIELQMEGAVG